MLDKIYKIIFNKNLKNNTLRDHIIYDYIENLNHNYNLGTRIHMISKKTSNLIMNYILLSYSEYPKWLIRAYIDTDNIYTYINDILNNRDDIVYKIEYIDNITISIDNGYNLDKEYIGLTIWELLIKMVFFEKDIKDCKSIWEEKYSIELYNMLKKCYNNFIDNY